MGESCRGGGSWRELEQQGKDLQGPLEPASVLPAVGGLTGRAWDEQGVDDVSSSVVNLRGVGRAARGVRRCEEQETT